MAKNDPSDYGAKDPTAYGNGGDEFEPVPGWRKPVALVGWGVLIAVLIGLIIWGSLQLMQDTKTAPATTRTTTATTKPPTTTTTPTTTTPTTNTTTTTTPPIATTPSETSTITTEPDSSAPSSQPHHLPHFPHL